MFLGLRTVIHPVADLEAAKAWFTDLLGIEPYFDQPFYLGFQVGGYELGLDPNGDVAAGPMTFWGVPSADAALQRLLDRGAESDLGVGDVGDGIRTAIVRLPHGGTLGIIENPNFALPASTQPGDGPGR